ncbi:PREDICTED: probable 2-oxoglutarate-dependent dioxygenase AOP1 isoform X2 [Tarenaya hassleriana]|uniref:probable 2-oxoglutarate-dependent dioxygenase AOP1 isoform X2 n=1 Tax=Tarenaya hassleriana TaxID=28532 RepID=UPI00053C5A22|nr:PREDICTED: probable 2-oxoglutarate-dependent dioxygenase AOP1 isoform X2 [Tarenaya hassleriana]
MYPMIPTLDFSREDLKPGTSYWETTSKNIRQALEQYGCFIVDLHEKAPFDLLARVFDSLKQLFDLPTPTKMKNKYDKPMNGYVGQIPALPLHESLGIDNATSLQSTRSFTDLMWPRGNDRFCDCMHRYAEFVAEMDRMVARMIFGSYGVAKYYEPYMKSTSYLLRLLKNRAPKDENPYLAFVTHTDKSFTTILHQDQINGLEMETRLGERINVDLSSPSLFMVIAGDALMAWSNDRILSPRHRVLVSGETDRYSLGQFAFSNGTLQVPEELVDNEHPLMYKPFDHIGLLHFYRTDIGYRAECPIKAYCGV